MGQVISIKAFNDTKLAAINAAREASRQVYVHRTGLTNDINCQRHTVKTLKELVTSMSDPRDQFIARQMHKEEQSKLDVLEAEYTGFYGEIYF